MTDEFNSWQPGQEINYSDFTYGSQPMKDLDIASKYKLLVSTITPRPIAWVSTISSNGTTNLAPFSFFNGVGTNPPAVMFSIVPKANGEKKDSLKNILETKEFVLNCANEAMLPAMHHSSAGYEYNQSEIEALKIKTLDSTNVRPPRIFGCPWHLECRLLDILQVGNGNIGSGTIVIGEILEAHIANECLTDGKIDFLKMKPVARVGGRDYSLATKTQAMGKAQTTTGE